MLYFVYLFSAEKNISRNFVCLAERNQDRVPTNREKLVLRDNGLGEKKVAIPVTASKDDVREIFYRLVEIPYFAYAIFRFWVFTWIGIWFAIFFFSTFPPLRSVGGFELLVCADNSRTKLQVVRYGACNTEELGCLGSGRIYIRPIQVDIVLGTSEDPDEHSEECLLCKELIPLSVLRDHMEVCPVCHFCPLCCSFWSFLFWVLFCLPFYIVSNY